ncbi:MAG: hypothetical protein JXA11_06290 [Phycisphaerae bacterium]|nr:hypothetical protein [Phycisphaerae bacterium]
MVTDTTEFLQKLLDAGEGIVTFPDGEFLITRPLEISDGTRLICSPRTHLKLADGANCPILRNRDKGPEVTRRVTIEGGVWDGNNLNQQRDQPKDDLFKKFFWFLLGFTYVEDFTLRGLTIKDPEAFGVQLTAADRFTVADITFDYNRERPNMDGIHVNGYARNGLITNLKGGTNDDMVALNSDEGGFACDHCDIENIAIDGLYAGRDGYTAVRLLSRKAKVWNVSIRHVFGAYRFNAVSFTHWADEPGDYGWFDGIALDGIFASCERKTGRGHGGLIWFQPGVRHVGTVTIHNVMRIDEPDAFNEVGTIEVSEDVAIENLVLRDIRQHVPDEKPPILIAAGANIKNLEMF